MTQTLSTPAAAPQARRSSGWVLAVVLVGQFMAVLDVSVVNVALPTVRSDLHASGSALQLIVAGYTISYAVLLITGARLGDLGGHGRLFRLGLALFTLASLACGLAATTGELIAFRLVQGAGAAFMVPQVFSLIQRNFAGPARARALSIYAAVIAGGAVVGQVVGGTLVSADLFGTGWRPVFLVNVPIGIALLVIGQRLLPRDPGEPGRTLDLPGVATLSVAVFALVLPLVLGHETGWPAWTWLSLAGSAVVFAVFAVAQRRTARKGGRPLIPVRVLRAPGLAFGATAILLQMATYGGFLLVIALHMQLGLGYSAVHSGLVWVPAATAFGLSSLNWRRVPARWHRRMIPAGLVLATLGYLGQAAVLAHAHGIGLGYWVSNVVYCTGMGAAFSPLLTTALRHVPVSDAADASGVLATITQLAQVIGVATFGTLYLSLAHTPADSPHAVAVTNLALAAVCLLAAVAAASIRSASRSGPTTGRNSG
jgi:MFS family permease